MEGEEKSEEIIERRKNKLKKFFFGWIEDKYDKMFIGVLILAFIIRLYYFLITMNQPLWWDEAEYMAYAKTLAGIGSTNFIIPPHHNSLFPYLIVPLLKIGLPEFSLRAVLIVIPSILLIYLTYKICSLMYKDKRIALISSFLMATFWELLFDSFRFLIDVPALLFAFMGILIFWKGYEKKQILLGKFNYRWALPLTTIFFILSYSIRRAYLIFGLFLFVYLLLTRDIKELLKDKYNWISLFVGILSFILLENLIFSSGISNVASNYYSFGNLSLDSFGIFGVYFNSILQIPHSNILLYLFWGGLIYLLFNLIILSDTFIKKRPLANSKSNLFIFLTIILTLLFFLFIMKINFDEGRGYDARWFFPLLLGSLVSISKGALFISDFFKRYSLMFSTFFLIGIILFGGYYELIHADQIIKIKLDSYSGVKESAILIKNISNSEDIIIGKSVPQLAYYSEMEVYHIGELFNESIIKNVSFEDFLFLLEENESIKYLIISFSEPDNPSWMRNEDVEYIRDSFGNIIRYKWEIPFMETEINFQTGNQQIKQEKEYGDIKFDLIAVNNEVFVYKISRKSLL